MTSGCRMGGCDCANTGKGKALTEMGQARSDEICHLFFLLPVFKWLSPAGRQTDKPRSLGRHGLTPGGITDRTNSFDNCPLWLRKNAQRRVHKHARSEISTLLFLGGGVRGGGKTDGRGIAVSLRARERECVCEREREGPLCPPETRKGIELICCCLVSAYGALSCTTVRGRGGEERAVLTHYELHHGHRRWAKGALPSLRCLPRACRPQWSRVE